MESSGAETTKNGRIPKSQMSRHYLNKSYVQQQRFITQSP
jgi:hypothetical protein